MPVLLANYQANIAVQAIKCHIQCHDNYTSNNKRQLVVGEKRTMSSKSSSKTGSQFQYTKDAANEDVKRSVTYCKQEQQQMQLLLQQHHLFLQHFAFGETNNGAQLDTFYRVPQHPTTSTALINFTPEAKHFHQLISNMSHQQQNYGNMMPQPVNSLPIVNMENVVALSTPAPATQANNKPDIEALNDLTARIRQTSSPSMSLFEMYSKSPHLIQDVSSIKTKTTLTAATSTSSLTAAPSSTESGIPTKSHNFNMSLDPQYQLQRHQQQQQQQQQQTHEKQPTKQDHEKQTILLRHNEMAHAINSSKLPPANTTTTEAAAAAAAAASSTTTKTSSEVASLVLTVATPPVDIQTLRANCKGG